MTLLGYLAIAIAFLLSSTVKADAYRFCRDLTNRVEKNWPHETSPMAVPYKCFADQSLVRRYVKGSEEGVPTAIADIRSGDAVLSMGYVSNRGSMIMVPCWDFVTQVHFSPVPEEIQLVSVDVGESTERRFYAFTSPEHPFLAFRQISKQPENTLDLLWMPAQHLRFSNRLVTLEDAKRSTNRYIPNVEETVFLHRPTAPLADSTIRTTRVYGSELSSPASVVFALKDRQPIASMVTLTTESTHNFFVKGHYHPDSRPAGDCAMLLVHNKI